MWFLTLILLIFILGIIILVHEFGHFITAKKAGVHIYEFSIGMGPIIKTHKGKDGINYNIRAFPIGGFVSMAGEVYEDDDSEKLKKEDFMCNKKWYQRVIILAAGVFNNFVLAIVVLFVMGLIWGAESLEPKIDKVLPYYPASETNIKKGDLITAINGHKVKSWDVAKIYLVMEEDDNIYDITVKHSDGKEETIPVRATTEEDNINSIQISYEDKDPEILSAVPLENNNYALVSEEGKAQVASITLKSEDGNKKVYEVISDNVTKEVELVENEKENTITIKENGNVTKATIEKAQENGKLGLNIEEKTEKGFFASIKYAFARFTSLISSMWITVVNLFTGKIALSNLSGPVGIYQAVGMSAAAGIKYVVYLIALLSINVGLINILPIPAFDGGRIFFLIIEKIKGSPVNQKFENWCHTIFFILLMLLMIYITIFDIIRF